MPAVLITHSCSGVTPSPDKPLRLIRHQLSLGIPVISSK